MAKQSPYKKEVKYVDVMGKMQPSAIELEEAVLGAIMLEKGAYNAVADILKEDDFYKVEHQYIWRSIVQLDNESKPIDILTVTAVLRKSEQLDLVGGAYYITSLTNRVASANNIEYHARLINEARMKRDLIHLGAKLTQEGYDNGKDVFELLDEAVASVEKIQPYNTRNLSSLKDLLVGTVKNMSNNKEGKVTGVPTGFHEFDRITGGLQEAEVIVIAARQGQGKSVIALSIGLNTSFSGIPTAIFSLEMSKKQLGDRALANISSINLNYIKKHNVPEYQQEAAMQAANKYANAPLYIDDTANMSIIGFRAAARRLKAEYGIKLLIIDYMQLMHGNQSGNREQEVSSISRGIKLLAKELKIPIIALAQVGRGAEKRADFRPMLSDLRESGSIEQDADMVVFGFRPEYYGIKQDEVGNSLEGIIELIIAKHRQGELASVPLKFEGQYTRVSNLNTFDNIVQDMKQDNYESHIPSARTPYKEEDDVPF